MLLPSLHFYTLPHHVKSQELLATTVPIIALFYYFESTMCSCLCKCKLNCSSTKHILVTVIRVRNLQWNAAQKDSSLVSVPSHVRADMLWQQRCYSLDSSHVEAPRDQYHWANAEIPQNSQALKGLSLSLCCWNMQRFHTLCFLCVEHILWLSATWLRSRTTAIYCCSLFYG